MVNIFRGDNNKLTIFQKPNIPATVWLIATIGARIFHSGLPHVILSIISVLAAFVWAMMELVSGVNYFRKILGFVVLFVTIYSVVTTITS